MCILDVIKDDKVHEYIEHLNLQQAASTDYIHNCSSEGDSSLDDIFTQENSSSETNDSNKQSL